MIVHELTDEQCVEILGRAEVARLGCSRADQPYVVPIHYSYDADARCLYCFSSVGRKVEWMRQNPKVCVEVDEVASRDRWASVVVFGRYEEIGDSPEEARVRERIRELFGQRAEWWLPGAARLPAQDRHAVVIYRIHIDRMTGRRAVRERA